MLNTQEKTRGYTILFHYFFSRSLLRDANFFAFKSTSRFLSMSFILPLYSLSYAIESASSLLILLIKNILSQNSKINTSLQNFASFFLICLFSSKFTQFFHFPHSILQKNYCFSSRFHRKTNKNAQNE